MTIPLLQTRALTIGYTAPRKPDRIVAANLALALRGGELVCLLGPNGSGKSTLLRTLAAMHKPLAGQVLLSGANVHHLPPRAVARRLSVVLTDRPPLGLLNGYALVAMGRHPHTDWMGRLTRYDEAVIRWAVEAVGASDLAERPVMELSDGQRQKFMIARALAQETDLILLDEPTAFLDLPRRIEITALLRQLARTTGRAILLSTHDLDLALKVADSFWLMSGGAVQTGAPEDMALGDLFEDAFGSAGVAFDKATASFRAKERPGKLVTVCGQGVAHAWTLRALERAGFAPAADGTETSVHVKILGDENRTTWQLDIGGQQIACASIRELLSALNARQADLQEEFADE